MTPTYSTSAALLFTEQELGGPCLEQDSQVAVTTTPSIILQGNGDRVGLLMINLGVNNVFISLDSSVASNNGIQLASGGGLISMNVRDDFTLPSRAWYGLAITGAVFMYVLEIIRYKSLNIGAQ